jgi:hypothetical protein
MKISKIIILFLAATAISCISQFTPEIVSQNDYLTVNGLVTDENRCYSIILGISHPLDETAAEKPAVKASVYVRDDLGNSYYFREKSPGKYTSDSTVFTGQPERSYVLSIEYNGKQYISSLCALQAAPPIDSLGFEVIDREINVSGEKEKVTRVNLSTLDREGRCHYFRWSFEETWEMHLPFNYLTQEKRYCWKTEVSHNILIANTEALSEDRITDLTLTTFNNSTDRGQFRYSMLVRQYAVSREEYEFWDKVRTMSENTGGLYDVTPVSVTGNIQCITDPAEIVLGYFSVSGVSHKRIFIKDPLIVPDLYTNKCVEDIIRANNTLPGLGYSVFILSVYEDLPDRGMGLFWAITSDKGCTDCAYMGSNVKPDYWDEGFAK